MKRLKSLFIASLLTGFLGIGVITFAHSQENKEIVEEAQSYYTPGTTYDVCKTQSDFNSYYSSASGKSGDQLLSALRSINSSNRHKTMGYSTMGTSISSSPYNYTDYDLNSTTTDSNGQVYGTQVASFYTKTATTTWNKEHVWPNSKGGSNVEGDILHTRPTISSENSSRGNSFYVEGMESSSSGWDPAQAGYDKECRGECARIILYSVVASQNLSLVASNTGSGNVMGNMNTLIKWHFDYAPSVYEMNRNNGAQYLQGNRNPFVDHPEYVAMIWSNFNSTVSNLCTTNASKYSNWTPGNYCEYGSNTPVNNDGVSISASTANVSVGSSTTLSATATNSGTISWTTSNSSVASISSSSSASGANITVTGVSAGTATITAKATINETQYSSTCTVTVTKVVSSLSKGSTSPTKTTYTAGESFDPTGLTITATYADNTNGNVTNSVVWSPDPLTAGTTSVTGTFGGKSITITGLTVNAPTEPEIIDSNSDLSVGDYVYLRTAAGIGVTGWNNNSDATVSETESQWKRFYVASASNSGFTLKDEAADNFIASPGSNQFTYGSAGTCSTDSSGHLICNSRYLCKNGNNYRFYTSVGSYLPFFIYKVPAQSSTKTLSSISIEGQKTSFTVDEAFSFGGTVTAHFSDSSTDNVTSSATYSGYDMSVAGNYTVTVSYTYSGTTKTTTYSITVNSSGGGSGGGESGDFSGTYNYGNQGTGSGKTWSLTDCSDQSSYWLCPATGNESIATIPGIFTDKTITSSVVITINSGTYGNGGNPSSDTFKVYNSGACTSQVTATQTGTLPTSKTYTNVIYTVSLANASNFSDDLAIKITKPGKQIRLVSISVEFEYTTSGGSSDTLTSISVATAPTKTTYIEGEYFDPTGLVITRNYSESAPDTYTYSGHTSEFTFSPSTSTALTTSNVNVTITYGGQSCSQAITVQAATLTSITTSGQKVNYSVGDTFSYTGTCTAHYNNGSQKTVTPTVNSSSVNMSQEGNYQVTLSYTEGGVTKNVSYTISVTTVPFVNSIEECYSKAGGASVTDVYGLFVGSGDGKSPILMNGEYGITLYKYNFDFSSWTENETYVKVSGTIDIYNGTLYEIKDFTATVVTNATEIQQNVAPVSIYDVTGNESSSDVTIASRLCMLTGTITSVNPTTAPSAGTEFSAVVSVGGHSINLYVKKNMSTADLISAIYDAKTSGDDITLKGYTTFYQTTFQIYVKEAVEVVEDYLVEDFAQVLLNLTDPICSTSTDKANDLGAVWLTLQTTEWTKLALSEKEKFTNGTPDEGGDVLARAIARYERVVSKYSNLSDFANRDVVRNVSRFVPFETNSESFTLLIVAVSAISLLGFTTLLVIKKKKHQ